MWRAWIICVRNQRKYLWIAMGFMGVTASASFLFVASHSYLFNAVTVFLTIVFRIAGTVISPINNLPNGSVIRSAIDILQITTLITSLFSNFTATGVVGATAWRHYKTIRAAFSENKTNSLRTNRILLLVVESGVLYCFSAVSDIDLINACFKSRLADSPGIIAHPLASWHAGRYLHSCKRPDCGAFGFN